MNRNYRTAFIVAAVLNLILLAGLGIFWWRSHRPSERRATHPANTMQTGNPAGSPGAPASSGAPAVQSEIPIAPVQLTPERMQSIGVKFGKAQYKAISDEIRVSGNVDTDEQRLSYVQVRFPGWIRKVYADATYQFIRKGQPLFTIYSPDLVTTEQEYLLAKRNAGQLQGSSISGVASGAESLVSAASERLQQWQVPASEMVKLERTGKAITELTFNSPVSGYITEKNVLPNMYVQPETKLYTVADLSTVWVYANVFQTDLGKVRPGNRAEVTVDAYPGKIFSGRVDQILPQIDMSTRTARVRLIFQNPGLRLSPGMFVNVVLKQPLGRRLVVPADAVFQSGTRQLVFVNQGEGSLDPREVQVGTRAGDEVVITRGLKAGEPVVTSANFLIDSEAQLQAAAGAFTPPPPGAGAAASMNAPPAAQQATVELSSEPSPPHKGSNIFRVKLTGAGGAAVSGAQVTVTFFMAAMPAMGMAAMKTTVPLAEKGPGMYEGQGDLASGGTWQATVTAVQNGKTIALKRLTVNAAGGM